MTKKLKIIGPYTPEHPGPFCTRDGRAVRVVCTDRKGTYPIIALVDDGNKERALVYNSSGIPLFQNSAEDLMNAEEVPVAREFWVNEYEYGEIYIFSEESKAKVWGFGANFIRTIHVREVLPGDAE